MRCGGLEERVALTWAGATEQLGRCTPVMVSTAFPHFLHLYGRSPNAEFAKTICAPGCTNTCGIVVVVVVVGFSVDFPATLLAALLISSGARRQGRHRCAPSKKISYLVNALSLLGFTSPGTILGIHCM